MVGKIYSGLGIVALNGVLIQPTEAKNCLHLVVLSDSYLFGCRWLFWVTSGRIEAGQCKQQPPISWNYQAMDPFSNQSPSDASNTDFLVL